MPVVFSNQLNALLVTDDISEQGVNVWKDNCFTVQHFGYQCSRKRTETGHPYGPTVPSYLDFTVKVEDKADGKVFYERMKSYKPFPYSFLFNANFDTRRGGLSSCEDALVAFGYIVEVEEIYSAPRAGGQGEQALLRGRLLLSRINYPGRERTLTLSITHD